jgi:Ricin-type beta-trefoil lectin domain-like
VTDSWSERPIPTEPADPQAMTPISSNAAGNTSDKAKAAKKSRAAAKGKTANAAPFIWDSGRIPGDVSTTPSPTPPAPPESKRSSPQRTQQTAALAEGNAASTGDDGRSPIGPPEGPPGGPGGKSRSRGTRLGLILIGGLAVAALLVWAITSILPKNSTKATVAVGTTATPSTTATSLHAAQPLGTSPIPVPSNTAKPSPSVTKTTHSAAPTPATVNVEITDMDDRLVLDVDNSGTSAGTLVGTWAMDNTTAQHWHLVAQPNGTYVIYSELADLKEGLEINTNANDYSGGAVTTLQSYDDDAAMQWTVKYLSSDEYELINSYNGQCLTGGGQGVANATSTCNTSNTHQAWTLTN